MTTNTTNSSSTVSKDARTLIIQELLKEGVTYYDLYYLLDHYRKTPVQYAKTGAFPTLPMILSTLNDIRKDSFTLRHAVPAQSPLQLPPKKSILSTAKSLLTFMSRDTARLIYHNLPQHAKQKILNFREPDPDTYAKRAEQRTKIYIALYPHHIPATLLPIHHTHP